MVVNKGTWRGARQYNFEEEHRRKKAARQKRIAQTLGAHLETFVVADSHIEILVLAVLIAWHPLQSVRINSYGTASAIFASAPNCSAARAVGLAPALRGQPGLLAIAPCRQRRHSLRAKASLELPWRR